MAARKLQSEIDRTLKKVSEGVEIFEGIYDKMQMAANQTQKEKLEIDLKTQIKKLQRMRDQIKTWVASNDIKDKSTLLDNRKLIETQMEKFKACEKEMKTKAFSKEGLIQAAKLDPKEQEKEEAMAWLQTQVEELQMQIEQAEAEIESLQGTGKKRHKGTSAASGRLEELEVLNERRKWHSGRLELVLRLLNNGSLATEQVNALKDDVEYFVQSNGTENFAEDEGIYDELNLDEEEEKFGLIVDDDDSEDSDGQSEDVPPRPHKKHDEESVTSSKKDPGSPVLKKSTLQLRKQSTDTKPSSQPSILSKPNPPAPTPRAPATLPPIRYAAAAAAAVGAAPTPTSAAPTLATQATKDMPPPTPSTTAPTLAAVPPTPSATQSSSQDRSSNGPSSPSLTHPSLTSPMMSSATSVSHQVDDSPAISEAAPQATSSPQQQFTPARKESVSSAPQALLQSPTQYTTPEEKVIRPNGGSSTSVNAAQRPAPSPLPQQVQQYGTTDSSVPQVPPGVKPPSEQPMVAPPQQPVAAPQQQAALANQRPPSTSQQVPSQRTNMLSSLSDLVSSFESVKQKAPMRMANLDQVHKMLEGGYATVPQPRDTEKPKYYTPQNPFQTAPYYPQTPLALLSTAAIFSQLDVETLFYVFYYLPGTYQQYLAAKELKRQSWRFHVKYLTWFQRHSEPQAITEEYEQGVYVYFDWEGSWCQRKKSDFRFEYRYLSED